MYILKYICRSYRMKLVEHPGVFVKISEKKNKVIKHLRRAWATYTTNVALILVSPKMDKLGPWNLVLFFALMTPTF